MKFLERAYTGCLITFGLVFLKILTMSIVFYLFWGWFIVGLFPGLPEISFAKSVGIMAFINLVLKDEIKVEAKANNSGFSLTVLMILKLCVILLIGFLINLFTT